MQIIRLYRGRLFGCSNFISLIFSSWGLLWLGISRLYLERGMSLWYGMGDWIGGYRFEVAKLEEIFKFYRENGFGSDGLNACSGCHGCAEFDYSKVHANILANEPSVLPTLDVQSIAPEALGFLP